MSSDEARRKEQKPPSLTPEQVVSLALTKYGVACPSSTVRELDSYDDRNYYLCKASGTDQQPEEAFVLKIHNGVESDNLPFLHSQNLALQRLQAAGLPCPTSCGTVDGDLVSTLAEHTLPGLALKRTHAVRLLTYLPGVLMSECEHTPEVLKRVGKFIGRMDVVLQDVDDQALERQHVWDLVHTPSLRDFVEYIENDGRRRLVLDTIAEFELRVLPCASLLRRSVIHGDANDQNILMHTGNLAVAGILDFGDMLKSWLVNDVAIAMAYATLGKDDPVEDVAHMLVGYVEACPLTAEELDMLPTLVSCRIACSVTLGAYSHSMDPNNEYLLLTQEPGWRSLEKLRAIGWTEMKRRWAKRLMHNNTQ
mmetsp:Transcript_31541/g.60804  ORF Transcript_31541/g.60804 Transcript_31541/m.60804 type:complete len:365 (-) Transcript_31541:227-1321(-)|eukprot:CAMPEP_0114244430 /NCGR_PEP_ID=MMETSP0058-20121206/11331_1 /TAXON_ID=36894 /ORGANISM="Pyramimonas parkeae, CCMP726" /LENGTH=364 /DNA_ID=CAMNT_0001357361 /DNA_START=137 /DNA_END=1231 /DNA_ORIENTATION=+